MGSYNISRGNARLVQKMDLPHDVIMLQILTRLPIKYLLKLKSVSKLWYSSMSLPHFGTAHLLLSPSYRPFSPTQYVFIQAGDEFFFFSCKNDDYEEKGNSDDVNSTNNGLLKLESDLNELKDGIFVVGSCNGLVCLVSLSGYLIIWNPIIHQWAKFSCPFPPVQEDDINSSIAWGFGYASSTDDYKVVRLADTEQCKEITVNVFSLRTQKWKQIHDRMLQGYSLGSASRPNGVFVNDTIYWVVDKQDGMNGQSILGFNLALERFDVIHPVVRADSYLSRVSFLCVMGGCLSMCRFTNRGDVSVAMLKERGQVEYIGLYRDMNLSSCTAMVGFTETGKFLIQVGDEELGVVDLNVSPKKYSQLVTFEGNGKMYTMGYTPSLVWPLIYGEMQKSSSGSQGL